MDGSLLHGYREIWEASVERIGGENTGMTTSIRRVVVASFIGTTIEWYDFFIYGTVAALDECCKDLRPTSP